MNVEIIKSFEREEDGYSNIGYDIMSDGATVGSADLMVSDSGAYCERIDIDEEYRCRGIGTEALRMLSSEHGSVTVAPDSDRSRDLYERIGADVSAREWMVDQGYGVYEI